MIREEYLRRLVDAAHVELYLSANDGARIYWPWRMQPPSQASTTYRNACEQYVIDSDPKDDSVTTKDVLDTAFRLDAEVASLADVYQDQEATVESLLRGLETADDHPFDGKLLLPLQDPYVECWMEIGEPGDDWIGIGGLKDAANAARIEATEQVRSAVGDNVHLHGFGWGPTEDLATAIRQYPGLLDSLDYSTPIRSTPVDISGKERMSVAAAYSGARLIHDLRQVSHYAEVNNPKEIRDDDQQGLDEIVQ